MATPTCLNGTIKLHLPQMGLYCALKAPTRMKPAGDIAKQLNVSSSFNPEDAIPKLAAGFVTFLGRDIAKELMDASTFKPKSKRKNSLLDFGLVGKKKEEHDSIQGLVLKLFDEVAGESVSAWMRSSAMKNETFEFADYPRYFVDGSYIDAFDPMTGSHPIEVYIKSVEPAKAIGFDKLRQKVISSTEFQSSGQWF